MRTSWASAAVSKLRIEPRQALEALASSASGRSVGLGELADRRAVAGRLGLEPRRDAPRVLGPAQLPVHGAEAQQDLGIAAPPGRRPLQVRDRLRPAAPGRVRLADLARAGPDLDQGASPLGQEPGPESVERGAARPPPARPEVEDVPRARLERALPGPPPDLDADLARARARSPRTRRPRRRPPGRPGSRRGPARRPGRWCDRPDRRGRGRGRRHRRSRCDRRAAATGAREPPATRGGRVAYTVTTEWANPRAPGRRSASGPAPGPGRGRTRPSSGRVLLRALEVPAVLERARDEDVGRRQSVLQRLPGLEVARVRPGIQADREVALDAHAGRPGDVGLEPAPRQAPACRGGSGARSATPSVRDPRPGAPAPPARRRPAPAAARPPGRRAPRAVGPAARPRAAPGRRGSARRATGWPRRPGRPARGTPPGPDPRAAVARARRRIRAPRPGPPASRATAPGARGRTAPRPRAVSPWRVTKR